MACESREARIDFQITAQFVPYISFLLFSPNPWASYDLFIRG